LEVGAASFTRVLGGKTKSILYRPRNRRADGSTGHDSKDQEQTSGLTTVKVASLYAFDAGQRANTLTFTTTPSGVDVTAPNRPELAPPGYYLVFVLNRNGVPSKGQVIKVQ